MKKFLIASLSLVLLVGMCFSFVGCGKLNNKTYAFEALTFTVIVDIEDKGNGETIITETKELSADEYYLFAVKHIALDKLPESKIQNSDKAHFEEWYKSLATAHENKTLRFTKDELSIVDTITNVSTGMKKEYVVAGSFEKEKDGDRYILTTKSTVYNTTTDHVIYSYSYFTIDASDRVHLEEVNSALTSVSEVKKGALYSTNVIFVEAKEK